MVMDSGLSYLSYCFRAALLSFQEASQLSDFSRAESLPFGEFYASACSVALLDQTS